ncbi:hypothetical protein H6F51_04425 [Cyanobacteria bacterium FACHB-DQ100]|uniref:hypothetical protein n=1 Tax=Leptolyngbya sp. DQ-M1 TaxID=2933920 RepID=UPI0019881DD4|nr:hypothetical protein [Cyanobacteria bacterium FACHB-DQ100]
MDGLLSSVDSQVVLIAAAIAVLILSSMLVIRILKAGAGLIVAIAAIVLVLQYGFGISFSQLWGEITNLPHDMTQLVQGFDFNALTSVFSEG